MNPLFFSGLSIAIVCIPLSILVPFFGRKKIHWLWSLFNLVVGIWALTILGVCLSGANKSEAAFYWKLWNIIGLLIACFFNHFICEFCKYPGKIFLPFSYLTTIIFLILSINNRLDLGITYVYGSFYYTRVTNFLYNLEVIFWNFSILYSHYILYRTIKISAIDKKFQIKYLLIAFSIGFISGGGAHWSQAYGLPIHPAWNIFVVLYPLIATYGIFRHKLLGLEIVVRKSIVYTLAISSVTISYFLCLLVLDKFFQNSIGYTPFLSLPFIIVAMLIFEPIRIKIQSLIDYRFFRGSIQSISNIKERLEKEVTKQEKMKAVATLAAGMAHEIKNPLTAIKTFAEFLPKKYDDPEFREKFSRLVIDEVDRVNNIVKQLLEFSKPSELELKAVLITDLLDETLTLLNSNLLKHDIELAKDFDRYAMILADKNQLKQAMLNLFLNAIQSIPSRGKLEISARAVAGGWVKILIKDTGCGMTPDQIQHAFDPFYTTKEDGTGLGLAIVHSIITKHGGKIEMASELGKGTTVSVFLKSQS